MGGSSSKESKPKEAKKGFNEYIGKIKSNVEDEIYKRSLLQREVQMSINIAKARDSLQIFGSLYGTLVTGVSVATIAGKKVPPLLFAPVVVGGIVLGNMADMAYGNKLQRIMKEAEYIMENESERFVPPKQAPFGKFYTEEQKAALYDPSTAVGDLWPSSMFARPKPK